MSTLKNESNDPIYWVIASLGVTIVFTLSFAFGFAQGINQKETEAIRMNVAEWVGDKDGKPQFKWKETQK